MSAYEVEQIHIHALVNAALMRNRYGTMRYWHAAERRSVEVTLDNAGQVGAMLAAENRRSVNYRYQENEIEEPYWFQPITKRLDPVKVLGALACYEYQSCETGDWPQTEAYAFCQALRKHMIRFLPGSDDAPWEVTSVTQVLA